MKKVYVNCPLCDTDSPGFVRKVKSLYSDELFNLVKCRECGLMYINPRQDWIEKEKALKIWKDDCGFEESEKSEIDIYKQVLAQLGGYKNPGRVLDIGCAAGGFLRLAREAGWEVYGVEINESVASLARRKHELNVFGGTIDEASFPDNYFDAVVTINTLEHIYEPSPFLIEVHRILKKGGVFYIMTPNYNNYFVRIAQNFGRLKGMDPIDPTAHPCIYTPTTLKLLLERHHFQVERVRAGVTGQIFAKYQLRGKLSKLLAVPAFQDAIVTLSDIVRGGSTLRVWAIKLG